MCEQPNPVWCGQFTQSWSVLLNPETIYKYEFLGILFLSGKTLRNKSFVQVDALSEKAGIKYFYVSFE